MSKAKPFLITIQPTIKQGLCWNKLRDKTTRFILFGGGAGGGKSWVGCDWLLTMCLAFPGTKWFVARNELKRIMKSTYITFQKVCKWHKIPRSCWKLNSNYNYIEFWNGSRIDLIDASYQPRDPLFERFGSEEYTSGWFEEAGEIKSKAFDVMKSRIGRHMNDKYNLYPKMLLTCNPKKNWIYFSFYEKDKNGMMPDNACFIKSLYNDNPYTAEEYGKQLSEIDDNVMKQRLKYGEWEYDDDDSALMTYDDILHIFKREFTHDINGPLRLTVDPARMGRDKAVFMIWQGFYIRKVWYYPKSKGPLLKEAIRSTCEQWHIPFDMGVVDQDGVGGFLVDDFEGMWAFVNNGKPIQEFDDDPKYRIQTTIKYQYKNLRAQCYHKLAEKVRKRDIGCYPEINSEIRDWIIQELEAIRKKNVEDNEKAFQIISKEEIKDVIGRSPDFSDNMMMRMVFGLGKPRDTDETLSDSGGQEVDVAW